MAKTGGNLKCLSFFKDVFKDYQVRLDVMDSFSDGSLKAISVLHKNSHCSLITLLPSKFNEAGTFDTL